MLFEILKEAADNKSVDSIIKEMIADTVEAKYHEEVYDRLVSKPHLYGDLTKALKSMNGIVDYDNQFVDGFIRWMKEYTSQFA